jgi:site-specific recombinase XerD
MSEYSKGGNIMDKKTDLKLSVTGVLKALEEANYCPSTISIYRRTFNRLLKRAKDMHVVTFCETLEVSFLKDSTNTKTGAYCHSREKLHAECIWKLQEYCAKGYIGWKPYATRGFEKPTSVNFQNLHIEFLEYLRSENKSNNTIESYRNISCIFLSFIERTGYAELQAVPVEIIHDFFIDIRRTWSSGSLRTAAAGLRAFLKFADDKRNLQLVVPLRLPKKRTIIPILTQQEECALWNTLKMKTVSIRDSAIMMILLCTGMRAVDIVSLKLRDIDWQCDVINITQKKTNVPLLLPLIPIIGNALAMYIMHERPKSRSPYVFLTIHAPYTPMKDHASCYAVVKKIFTCAGIRLGNELKGTRLLRHHVASKMLRNGVALQTISSTLGHINPQSTDVYLTSVDLKLRECVLPLSSILLGEGGLMS